MRAVALAIACLLLAAHTAAAGRGLKREAQLPARRLHALLPGLKTAAAAPAPAPEAEPGAKKVTSPGRKAASGVLVTSVAYGEEIVACKEWLPSSMEWDWPSNPTEYSAAGNKVPSTSNVKKLTDLICSDPEAAGEEIRTAVKKGGADAQAAVYSIFAADCEDSEAPSDAYAAAIDAVNSGDPADIDVVSSWFESFAAAADAVGIPVCMSLAVVDTDTGKASDEREFHTTGPAPSTSKPKGRRSGGSTGSGSGTGSAGGSTDTTTGSGVPSSVLDVPDSADPGTTSDGVQAAEVIAGASDAPVFVGGP